LSVTESAKTADGRRITAAKTNKPEIVDGKTCFAEERRERRRRESDGELMQVAFKDIASFQGWEGLITSTRLPSSILTASVGDTCRDLIHTERRANVRRISGFLPEFHKELMED
jgi:hypothetical protein